MTTLELAMKIRGGNVSAVEVADAIDAYIAERLEQAMPKILAAIRSKDAAEASCTCGHEKRSHLAYFGECYKPECKCRRFKAEGGAA